MTTTTSLTPAEGLVRSMQTDALDPEVLQSLMTAQRMDVSTLEKRIDAEPGWLGVSGLSAKCEG